MFEGSDLNQADVFIMSVTLRSRGRSCDFLKLATVPTDSVGLDLETGHRIAESVPGQPGSGPRANVLSDRFHLGFAEHGYRGHSALNEGTVVNHGPEGIGVER